MGEPEVATTDPLVASVLQSLLDPQGRVDGLALIKTGLHRTVLQQYFEAISPEIKNLPDWLPLREFSFSPSWRNVTREDERAGSKRTERWRQQLEEAGVADEEAILIFDGERMPAPAPDYRLFVLRDGRLLHYAGGHYVDDFRKRKISCGDPLAVLEAMGDGYDSFGLSSRQTSFMIIMDAMNRTLEKSVKHRRKLADDQSQLHEQLAGFVRRIT